MPIPSPDKAARRQKRTKPARTLADASVLTLLQQLGTSLPPTAKRIAAYIEDKKEEVIRMSITELADQAGASEGSVVGLCHRLGIKGFQELKILLARELVAPIQRIQEDLHADDDVDRVSDHVFAAHAASLEQTRKLLKAGTLQQAVDILRGAKRIDIYGIGSSAPIAQDLGYRLLQLGYDVRVQIDSHVQAVSAAMSDATVATVTISHSGATLETVLATRLAREAGARTIGITRIGKSPLSRYCEVVLSTVANETRYRPEAMSSRVAQLAIIDTLVSCCALSDADTSVAMLELSSRVLAGKRF